MRIFFLSRKNTKPKNKQTNKTEEYKQTNSNTKERRKRNGYYKNDNVKLKRKLIKNIQNKRNNQMEEGHLR